MVNNTSYTEDFIKSDMSVNIRAFSSFKLAYFTFESPMFLWKDIQCIIRSKTKIQLVGHFSKVKAS